METTNVNVCTDSTFSGSTISGEDGDYVRLQIYSDDLSINDITTSADLEFDGYYEIRFIKLNSDRYTIDDENNMIDVETDDNDTILENVSLVWTDGNVVINDDKLQVYYGDELLKEYTLVRIINPSTGSLYIGIAFVLFIIFVGGIYYFGYKKRKVKSI